MKEGLSKGFTTPTTAIYTTTTTTETLEIPSGDSIQSTEQGRFSEKLNGELIVVYPDDENIQQGEMTGKGKKVQRSDVETPSSPPSKNKRRKTSATADAGGPSSSPSTSKVKKTYAKVAKCHAKRVITTEEQSEGVQIKRRRKIRKRKDVTCKRRGEKQLQETEPPPKFPSLNTRTTPASFHDSLRKLNDAQKQAVIDIGFGSILNLKVKKLPARLAFWILEKFDERSCELELAGGIKVQITEDDVYRVYGFPKGSEIIPNFERTSNNAMCLEWSSFFGFASREKIKIGAVLSEMLNCSTGGSWFKRHFMIAMAHSLIESCTSGTVHPYILRCLENVTTLRNWNWGEYVLRSLIDHKKSWIGDEDKVFAGPSLFIVLFYVDRCQIHRQIVKRDFPVLVNWSSAELRTRQKTEELDKKFGHGKLLEPIVLPSEYATAEEQHTEDPDLDETDTRLGTKIMEKGLSIGKQLENLRLLIHSASEVDKETQYYHDCVEAACKITGLIVDVNGPKPWRRPRDMHPEDDPFFYLDEVQNSVDAACDKVQQEKRKERVSTDDIPSFDLHGVDGVLTVNSEVNIGCGDEGSSMRNNNDFRKKANENVVNGMEFAEIGKGPDKETNEQTVHGVSADGTAKADDGAGVVANTSAQRIADPVVQQSDPQKEMVVEKNSGDAIDVGGAAKDGEEGIVAAAIRGEATKPVDKGPVRRSVRVRGGPMNTPTVGQKDGVGGQDLNYRKATRLPLGNIDANIPGQATKNGKTPMKSLLKKTSQFRSPFLQREISTSKQLTTQEKEVGVYALCANEDKMDEILFRFRGVDLRRRDTQSLKRGSVVEASIINAWSVVLNGQEQYRSTTSPTRFFATMDIYGDCIEPTDWSYVDQKRAFFMSLYAELSEYHGAPLSVIDLFFFPVFEDGRYYALCFDTRRKRLYILDSTIDITENQLESRYTNVCQDMRQLFADYLYYNNEERKANVVANSVEQVVKIKWADRGNTIESGVYLMRHLETFMGDGTQAWKCDVSSKRPQQFTRMRIRYCASILTWESNEVSDVANKASDNFKEMCEDPDFNVNQMLLG